jgi:hypothetical protein
VYGFDGGMEIMTVTKTTIFFETDDDAAWSFLEELRLQAPLAQQATLA